MLFYAEGYAELFHNSISDIMFSLIFVIANKEQENIG